MQPFSLLLVLSPQPIAGPTSPVTGSVLARGRAQAFLKLTASPARAAVACQAPASLFPGGCSPPRPGRPEKAARAKELKVTT